jgi:hypothetical protein
MPRIPVKLVYPFTCPYCRKVYDQSQTLTCPYCGKTHHRCPDLTCGYDLTNPKSCLVCFKLKHTPPSSPTPLKSSSWGGRRAGAGAPKGTMNHLVNGSRSAQIRRAIDVLAEHEELRPLLYLVIRLATEGEVQKTTMQLIEKSLAGYTAGGSMRSV